MKAKKYSNTRKNSVQNSLAPALGASKGLITLILVCFFFSGQTGLIYQILWTRMIVKIIGGTPFAVSIILTVFMAGLGLGSYWASRIIDRIQNPYNLVKTYGILEIIIGVYGLILPALLVAFRPVYSLLYNHLFDHFMLYNFLTFLGCGLLLITPAICMGATLPILSRFYVSRLSHLGSHVGRLYGLNTIGAAVGALVCGFWLINLLGMTGTLGLTVTVNFFIGLICIFISKRQQSKTGWAKPPKSVSPRKTVTPKSEDNLSPHLKGVAFASLIIFATSGFCAMAYEVIWTKLLGLIIGPTTYSFTIVLVTFITGLALGSMLFGWLADRTRRVIELLIYTQIAAALSALLISQALGNSQFFFAKLIYEFQDNFVHLSICKALIIFCFMLIPTLFLGATFPIVGKIFTQSISHIGRSIGFAYAINTIGAVLGSFCAGFLLVPLLGKENGLRLVIGIQLVMPLMIGVGLMWINRTKLKIWAPAIITALMGLILCFYFPTWNRLSLSLGRYHRIHELDEAFQQTGWMQALHQGSAILAREKMGQLVFYEDGIAGFTTVLKYEDIYTNIDYSMIISGKPDAGTNKDMSTQTLSAHFPMMFHPAPKNVMVLGLASGITAGEILHYPIDRLDVLEISREVVHASSFFEPWNNHVLANPKTELIVQDGRAHLLLTDRMYDVIISEPSNPWMAGLAALFTQDYFNLARDRLNPNGIFAQFVHSYQMDWEGFAIITRTFLSAFPESILVQTRPGDYLMIGFTGPNKLDLAAAQKNLKYAQQSSNLELRSAELLYRFIATEDMHSIVGAGPINTDNNPRLEYSAPKNLYIDDPAIQVTLNNNRKLNPDTQNIVQEITDNVDAQIDYAALLLSINSYTENEVDFSRANPEQKDRFQKIIESHCATGDFVFSILPNEQLKYDCRTVQIDAIRSKLDVTPDKVLAYYTMADLARENKLYSEAEVSYRQAILLKSDHAELYNDFAVVLHLQGKLREAVINYDKALALKPDYPTAQENRQKALSALNKVRHD